MKLMNIVLRLISIFVIVLTTISLMIAAWIIS